MPPVANFVSFTCCLLQRRGGGYGPELATGAIYIEVENVAGILAGLKTGDKLALVQPQETNSASEEHFVQLVVKDMLNQTVSGGTKDAGE